MRILPCNHESITPQSNWLDVPNPPSATWELDCLQLCSNFNSGERCNRTTTLGDNRCVSWTLLILYNQVAACSLCCCTHPLLLHSSSLSTVPREVARRSSSTPRAARPLPLALAARWVATCRLPLTATNKNVENRLDWLNMWTFSETPRALWELLDLELELWRPSRSPRWSCLSLEEPWY